MTCRVEIKRRVSRLLCWYPREWRNTFGDEFAGYLEQEIEERPRDLGRTLNIAYSGLTVRLGDSGLFDFGTSSERIPRAAIGTSFALGMVATVLAASFWGRAMLQWNAIPNQRASLTDSVVTGVLTVETGLLILLLVVTVLTVMGLVARQLLCGRIRPLVKPLIVSLGSGVSLLYVVGLFSSLPQELRSISWMHPGLALKSLGEIAFVLTDKSADIRNGWIDGSGFMRSTVSVVAPIVMAMYVAIFAIAVASLWRRVEMSRQIERLGVVIAKLMGYLTTMFLINYLLWVIIGGPLATRGFAWPLSRSSGELGLTVFLLATVFVRRLAFGLRVDKHVSRKFFVVGGPR